MPKPRRSRRKLGGVTFLDSELLEAALSHPSYRNERPPVPLQDFDRLEFFGDAVLNYIVCVELMKALPDANEGTLSRFRSTLVSRKILARVAQEMKLGDHLKLGRGLVMEKGVEQSKILADAFEALIAAIYEDQGLGAARKFILRHLGPYVNPRRLIKLDPNPKSTLQELTQKKLGKTPEYSWKSTRQGIEVQVRVGIKHRAVVRGENRRELEEKAARELLRKLRRQLKLG